MDPSRTIDRGDAPVVAWFRKPWEERLAFVLDWMREVSQQTVPEEMVRLYVRRMSTILQAHRRVTVSRRDLEYPYVRITGSDLDTTYTNPWKQRAQLPILKGGILAELAYNERAVIDNDLSLSSDDPAYHYFAGMKSFTSLPLFDQGKALNMVVLARTDQGFSEDFLPEHVWFSNLFGRATANLVLKEELREAYEQLDRELKVVADIQRSLLPVELPRIDGLDIAAYYQTSRHAGGDYYDFFHLPDGRLGILIADVSGHGTPAAVMMAVTHSIAHTHHGSPTPPSRLLNFINKHLASRYTQGTGTFVTAFYGIYDPSTRELVFANAGHNPPRLKRGRGGPNGIIEGNANLPLGIDEDETYTDNTQHLAPGDILVFYTDGITEARSVGGAMFETARLDEIISRAEHSSQELIDEVMLDVERFTDYRPPQDDRTMLVMQVS